MLCRRTLMCVVVLLSLSVGVVVPARAQGPDGKACELFKRARGVLEDPAKNMNELGRRYVLGTAIPNILGFLYGVRLGEKSAALAQEAKSSTLGAQALEKRILAYEAKYLSKAGVTSGYRAASVPLAEQVAYQENRILLGLVRGHVRSLGVSARSAMLGSRVVLGAAVGHFVGGVLSVLFMPPDAHAATLSEYYEVHPEMALLALDETQACAAFTSHPRFAKAFLALGGAVEDEERSQRILKVANKTFAVVADFLSGQSLVDPSKVSSTQDPKTGAPATSCPVPSVRLNGVGIDAF